MATAYQNNFTSDQYPFNSSSNVHVKEVYWISLHPKKAILPTCIGQTPNLLGEKQKNRTNNLHHWKAVSVAVFLA